MGCSRFVLVTCVVTLGLLVGCGDPSSTNTPMESAPKGGDEPTTPASLAFVGSLYVGEPVKAFEGSHIPEAFNSPPVAASLDFEDYEVQVVVGRNFVYKDLVCESLDVEADRCVNIDGGMWFFETGHPEEDPGGVFVATDKGDGVTAVVAFYGETITKNPEEMGLEVGVDTLIELCQDPRVDLTTSKEAVDEGEVLSFWKVTS